MKYSCCSIIIPYSILNPSCILQINLEPIICPDIYLFLPNAQEWNKYRKRNSTKFNSEIAYIFPILGINLRLFKFKESCPKLRSMKLEINQKLQCDFWFDMWPQVSIIIDCTNLLKYFHVCEKINLLKYQLKPYFSHISLFFPSEGFQRYH